MPAPPASRSGTARGAQCSRPETEPRAGACVPSRMALSEQGWGRGGVSVSPTCGAFDSANSARQTCQGGGRPFRVVAEKVEEADRASGTGGGGQGQQFQLAVGPGRVHRRPLAPEHSVEQVEQQRRRPSLGLGCRQRLEHGAGVEPGQRRAVRGNRRRACHACDARSWPAGHRGRRGAHVGQRRVK
eukprot:scaffold1153_cov94-Isochrysis_galbana.AAC.8